ncbi:EamA family transporter [Streptacidiphilus sp. PB12-B1b]|uniref:EamA family transporter n=1 Tax=Streptacidiphilus sp. PB12-B1b TaxID=2705012 RepID=UPI0015F95D33|nr:DMT family transporter [Streptacidiphilus sp. PB12-B1b]QMU74907.1 EamA family transporter [Streptacidiphilus sp. PB12-B1b]
MPRRSAAATRGSSAPARSRRTAGLVLILISACAFGGSGTAAKPLMEAGLSALDVVWLRAAGATLVLLPVLIKHRDLPRRRPGLLIGFGLFAVAGCQGLSFASLALIPVGVALLIEYLGPPLLLGYVRFVQRRRVSRQAALGALLALIGLGCVVQVWDGFGGLNPWGVLLGLGAAFCQVGYFVLAEGVGHGSDAAREPVSPIALSAWGLLVGTLVFSAVARPWDIRWSVFGHDVAMGGRQVPALLLLGWVIVIATVVAYLTGTAAVSRLSAPVAGVIASLEAVVGTVLAWVLLGEHLDGPQILGGLLVLTGACVAQTTPIGATAEGSHTLAVGPALTEPVLAEAALSEATPSDAAPADASPADAVRPGAPRSRPV